MQLKKLDSSKIEKIIYDYLKSYNVANFIMGGHRNESINFGEMVYCNAPLPIFDKNAIGSTMMRIEIYVKQSDGYKNATKLTAIHDKIVALFPITLGDYNFEYISEISGTDNSGYDYIFINTNVMIYAKNNV